MVRLFIRHHVADVRQWMNAYLANSRFRDANAVVAEGVYQTLDDLTDLTVWHDFETVEAAKAFAGLPELKAKMDEIGVTEKPKVWITSEIGR